MTGSEVRRILVALDASPQSRAALEQAALMAARLQAELTGIFVLDTDLLRLAALPVARETGLTSATRRSLDPGSMERALRLQGERARQALDDIARIHGLESTFRLIRGNVAAELQEAAEQVDLIAMGARGHMTGSDRRLGSTARTLRARFGCSMLLLTPGQAGRITDRAVVVLFCGSPDADRALELGMELAARHEAPLTVVLHGGEATHENLKNRVSDRLKARGQSAVFATMAPGELVRLRTLIREHHGGLAVIGHDCPLIAEEDDRLALLGVPVLLARDSGAGSSPDEPA